MKRPPRERRRSPRVTRSLRGPRLRPPSIKLRAFIGAALFLVVLFAGVLVARAAERIPTATATGR